MPATMDRICDKSHSTLLLIWLPVLLAQPAQAQLGVPISKPAALNNNAASDTGHDAVATIVTDGAGTWLAAWSSRESFDGALGTDLDILMARSGDGGVTWSDPLPLNNNADVDGRDDGLPSLATDGAGSWVATWQSRFDQGTGPDREIIFAHSQDDGATWSDPAPLNTNATSDVASDHSPHLTTDGLGTWVVVWAVDPTTDPPAGIGFDDADILSAHSLDGGASWSDPVRLTPTPQAAGNQAPKLATDGPGVGIATWGSTDPLGGPATSDFDLLVARSEDGGASWSTPVHLNTDAAADPLHDAEPEIATDGAGHWLVAWTRVDTRGAEYCCSSPTEWDLEVLVSRSLDDGATWSAPAPLNSLATGAEDEIVDALVSDDQGSWLAVWRSTHTLGDSIGSDFDFLVARSADLGRSWTDPVPLNTNAASDSTGTLFQSAHLATDRLGRWVATMDSDDPLDVGLGTDGDILVARFDLDAAAAGALDLRIERFASAWSQTSVYLPSDTLNLTLDLEPSVQCTAPAPRFDADFRVVALDGAGQTTAEFPLGGATFEPEEVSLRESPPACGVSPCTCQGSGAGAKRITLAVSGGGFETFLAAALEAGRALEVRARIDAAGSVVESDETNNEAADPLPALLPLSGEVHFGPIVGHLRSFIGFDCGGGALDLSGSEIEWTPSPNGRWETVRFLAPAGLCARRVAGDGGFDLVALGSVAIPRVSGEMGGLSVQVLDTQLGPAGATPGSLRVSLPDGHSRHDKASNGLPVPRGDDFLAVPLVSPDLADFAEIEASIPSEDSFFLHANGMPLSFEVLELKLTQDAVTGMFASAHYHYALPFDASDPRADGGAPSNDARLRNAAAASEFALDAGGLQVARVAFGGGTARTHFPRMNLLFADFELRVENGNLAPGQRLPRAERYWFDQATACHECPSPPRIGAPASPFFQLGAATQGLASDGAVAVRTGQLGENPRWGPFDKVSTRNVFDRTGDDSLTAILFLPGYRALGTGGSDRGGVAGYLLGMRQLAQDESDGALLPSTHYALGTAESASGSHFMAGVTLGPELYPPTGDPGVGQDLSGTGMEIGFGGPGRPDFQSIVSNAGTKYVIRPGGVTGVFNTDTAPQPTVYGFPLRLSRFGFRQVVNRIDATSWIDGAVSVPTPGGFEVLFSSLELQCSANFGSMLVESCGDGQGEPAESCLLAAWQADYELLDAGFEGACRSSERVLRTEGIADIVALDRPVELSAAWASDGTPVPDSAVIRHGGDYVVDGGFRLAVEAGAPAELGLSQGERLNEFGWFSFTGDIGVPFWDILPVQTRLQNSSAAPPVAQPSLVVAEGWLDVLQGEGEERVDENDALVPRLGDDDVTDTRPRAVYTWIDAYGIDLPLYYAPNDDAGVRFKGVSERLFDLVVLDARAGVDWVTPERTKLSFGASADFQRLAALDFDLLHVDVGDPDSISSIDNFLNTIAPGVGTPVATMVADISGRSGPFEQVSRLVGGGIDDVLEEAVAEAIAAIGAPLFEDVSRALAQVHAVPAQITALVEDLGPWAAAGVLLPLAALDEPMAGVYDDLPDWLWEHQQPTGTPRDAELRSVLRQLEDVERTLGDVEGTLAGLRSALDTLQDDVSALVGGSGEVLRGAQTAIGNLRSDLGRVNLVRCGAGLGGAVGGRLDRALAAIDELRSALGAVNLEGPLEAIATVTQVDLSAVASAERDVRSLVEDAGVEIARAVGDLDAALNGLCSSSPAPDPVREAHTYLTVLDGRLSQLRDALGILRTRLLGETGPLAEQLEASQQTVHAVREVIRVLGQDVQLVLEGGVPNRADWTSAAAIRGSLDAEIFAATGMNWGQGRDSGTSFVTPLANSIAGPFQTDLASALREARGNVDDVMDQIPSPTAPELQAFLTDLVMSTPVLEDIQDLFKTHLAELFEELTSVTLAVFDQLNHALRSVLEQVQSSVRAALDEATGLFGDWGFRGGKLDGFATIQGDALERLHVAGEWTMLGGAEENTTTYGAALDVLNLRSVTTDEGCPGQSESGGAALDARITGSNLPFRLGLSDARLRRVWVGFTLAERDEPLRIHPVGISGGLEVAGTIDFNTFQLYDIAFASGIGATETFLGGSAGASFDDTQMEMAFLVGRTCSDEVLVSLDPQVANFITLPPSGFQGAFARGSASFPVWSNGCVLTVGVGADAGSWLLIGPPLSFGGLLGGAAFGKVLCIGALRGQVTLIGEKVGLDADPGSFRFEGEGWGAAGVGFCEPGGWSSRARSRDDSWCGTGDAGFSARYDEGFQLLDRDTSAVH